MSSVISDWHFHDKREAYAYVEARLWPNGLSCLHCGNADETDHQISRRVDQHRGPQMQGMPETVCR
jgi:hypothetical protein